MRDKRDWVDALAFAVTLKIRKNFHGSDHRWDDPLALLALENTIAKAIREGRDRPTPQKPTQETKDD